MATTPPKPAAKKSPTSRSSGAAKKKTAAPNKYGAKASRSVAEELREMKRGELRSGSNGEVVTDRKQAIAIGLSEARRSGAKVPPKPNAPKKST